MVDSLLVAIIHALGCDSGEIFAIHILGEQPVDVALVPGDVLALQFMGGASYPCHSVLDLIKVRNSLCSLHISYIN